MSNLELLFAVKSQSIEAYSEAMKLIRAAEETDCVPATAAKPMLDKITECLSAAHCAALELQQRANGYKAQTTTKL